MAEGQIPCDGAYRGVPLHAGQSEARLAVVRRDIDAVHSLQDIDALVPYSDDTANAPEARLFATAKALSILDDAIERRAPRSRMTVWSRERIRASTAGTNSVQHRSPTHYCSIFDVRPKRGAPGPARRETPLEGR